MDSERIIDGWRLENLVLENGGGSMVYEERLVDITRTLDKIVVGLLFVDIVGFSAIVFFSTNGMPGRMCTVGLVAVLTLLVVVVIMGSILSCCGEKIYQKWLQHKLSGEPDFCTVHGEVIQRQYSAKTESADRAAAQYDIVIKLDRSEEHEMRVTWVGDEVESPVIGEHVTIVMTSFYDRRRREILKKTTLHRNV